MKIICILCLLLCALSSAATRAADTNSNWRTRSNSLSDSGYSTPTVLNRKKREQHFYFRIAQNIEIKDAYLEIEANYLHQFASADGLSIQINGVSTKVLSLSQGGTPLFLKMTGLGGHPLSAASPDHTDTKIKLTIPLKDIDSSAGFVDVNVSFNSEINGTRCAEIDGLGNEVVLSPLSRIRYRYDMDSVTNVRSFLSTLPNNTQILVPNHPSAHQYEGALRLLMGLRTAGLHPQLTSLPKIGDQISLSELHLPSAMSGKAMFKNIAAALDQKRPLRVENNADIAGWLALRLISENGFADIAIGSEEISAALIQASQIWTSEGILPLMPAPIKQAVADRWKIKYQSTSTSLRVVNWAGTQLLILDDQNINPAALLISSFWSALATGSELDVIKSGPLHMEPVKRLMFARNLPVQYLINSAKWDIPFYAKDWPSGKRPDSIQLNILAANKNTDDPAIASVFINDNLLTAQKLNTDGSVTLVNASIPFYSLKASNIVRVEVSGPAQKDCTAAQAIPVQILPSSYVGLTTRGDPKEFFALIPALTHDSKVVIPASYLLHPENTLLTIGSVLQGLQMPPDGFKLQVADHAKFTAKGAFISFEVPPENMHSLVESHLDKLIVRDKKGTVVFDSRGLGNLAVAQLIEEQGVLVSRVGTGILQLQHPMELSAGNLAVMDKQGVQLVLNTNDPDQNWNLNESNRGLKYYIQRYHRIFVLAMWLLALSLAIWATKVAWTRARARARRTH